MKKTDSKIKKPIRVIFVVIVVAAIVLMYCIGPMAYVFAETRNGVDISANGAAAYIDESNSFAWDYNGDAQLDPDGLTMMLTCLIASENLDHEEEVTVSGKAINEAEGASWLKDGEVTKVDALVHLAIMGCDCTAARMLALLTSESEEDFVQLMNEKAIAIGCTKSEFHNATGHLNAGNLSTAKDICLIAEAAMDNELVRDALTAGSYQLPATNANEARTLTASNLFLAGGTAKNAAGADVEVKAYGSALAGMVCETAARRTVGFTLIKVNELQVYSAVLDDEPVKEYGDTSRMAAATATMVQPYKAIEKGTPFEKKAKVKNGAVSKVSGEAGSDGYVNLLEGASASLILVEPEFSEEITAPIKKGDVIGKAVIYLADVPVSSVDIVATSEVKEGWIFSRIGIPNSVALIIMIVLAVIIIAFTALSIVIRKNKAKSRAIREARIKEIALKQLEQEKSARERDWPYR